MKGFVQKTGVDFKKAYMQGFRDGHRKGSMEPSKKIISNDLKYVYGAMCIVLKEQKGMDVDELEQICTYIQNEWNMASERRQKAIENGEQWENFLVRVKRISGVDLEQVMYFGEYEDEE